jgi:hypothetical protein
MIVPGSLTGQNHPFSWYALVKDKKTGKQWTLWINGNQLSREGIAEYLAVYFTNAEPITIDRCTEHPIGVLQPVPPQLFEFGIREKMEEILRPPAVAGPRPIPLKPLSRQPL